MFHLHLHQLVFCTKMSVPQKGGNLEETGTLFLILKAQHYRSCEKLKTVE